MSEAAHHHHRRRPAAPGQRAHSRRREIAVSFASPSSCSSSGKSAPAPAFSTLASCPPPTKVAVTICEMIKNDDLLRHTGVTTLRFLVGMIVGTAPGCCWASPWACSARCGWC